MRTLREDARVRVRTHADLMITEWTGKGSPDDMRQVYDLHRVFREELGNKAFSSLAIVYGAAIGRPEKATNAVVEEHAERSHGWLKAEALVIAADGFAASMLRGVVTGMLLVVRPAYDRKVCSTIKEGCDWIVGFVTPPMTSESLQRLLQASK